MNNFIPPFLINQNNPDFFNNNPEIKNLENRIYNLEKEVSNLKNKIRNLENDKNQYKDNYINSYQPNSYNMM